MSRIDELTDRITPEKWLEGLRAAKKEWEGQLNQLLVDRAILETSTKLRDKELILARQDEVILELDARVTEIEERIEAMAKGATGNLPRAARRRLQKQLPKEESA